MIETQESISKWADETFGKPKTNLSIAIRANEEMAELLSALTLDDNAPDAMEEVADILIVLYRLLINYNCDIQDVINYKMILNRERKWKLNGTGHGYHL